VSPTTGVAEVVEPGVSGLVVAPTVDALEQTLRGILENPSVLPEIARRALTVASETFSFAAHGEALRRAYEAVLSRSTVPAPAQGAPGLRAEGAE
jgi:glycosyltransferase involved in cell wall biosynthesis